MSLRNKILCLSLGPVVVVMISVVTIGLYQLRDKLIAEAKDNIRAELTNAAKTIDGGAREALAVARLVSHAEAGGLFGKRAESIALAREILENNPRFMGISIGYEPNADGGDARWLAAVGPDHPSTDASGRFIPHWFRDMSRGGRLTLEPLDGMGTAPYYQGLREQFARNPRRDCMVTEPYVYNNQNLIVEQSCVININGMFQGVAAVDRGLDKLTVFIESLKPIEESEFVLVSGRGRIITTTLGAAIDSAIRTAKVRDLYLDPNGRLATDIFREVEGKYEIDPGKASPAERAAMRLEFQQMLTEVMRTSETGAVIEVSSALDSGNRYFASATVVPSANWTLLMSVSRNAVISSVRSTMIWVLLVALAGAALVVWLLIRLANGLSGRIVSINERTRLVADGDLTAGVEVESDDETGRLQQAVRDMLANLNLIVGKVKRSSIRLTSASNEIAAGTRQQAEAMNEFASSTNEITSAARQIRGTSEELLETVNHLNRVAGETASLAGEGQQALTGMAATMSRIDEATSSIAAQLGTINEKAGNINLVVTTIVKVADQTNLLSLNAAVEADKAGEHGLGFAVVASEIRRLADQTAVATLDIERTVEEMQSSVNGGVMEMEKFTAEVRQAAADMRRVGGQLETIIGQVQGSTARIGSVAEGMAAQAEGARQISDALANLLEGVRETTETLQEYRRAGENLDRAVRGLREELSRFKMKDRAPSEAPLEDAG